MTHLAGIIAHTPLLAALAVMAPALAVPVVRLSPRSVRWLSCLAAFLSAAAATVLTVQARGTGFPAPALMLLFAGLALGAFLLLPRRDCRPGNVSAILCLLAATMLALTAGNLWVLLVAWVLSLMPLLLQGWLPRLGWRAMSPWLISTLALALAAANVQRLSGTASMAALVGRGPGGILVFALLAAAVALRAGLWPAHTWIVDAAERGPALPVILFMSSNFGALLLARVLLPLFPVLDHRFPVVSVLAIATAVLAALATLPERSPRRLVALIALSQSACVLVGIECGNTVGDAGALAQWYVTAVAAVALFAIVRLLEVRFGQNLDARRHWGLAQHAPRLAVLFAIFGLALVGLPGTLGFLAQDLLLHGVLSSHPWIGMLLPLAVALDAVSLFRLFTRLFLGRVRTGYTVGMADARPRERWALTIGVLFLVVGGLFPAWLLARY